MQTIYTKKVLEHFKNPRNLGSIKNPDGVGESGNPICGDRLKLYIKVGKKKNKEFIKDIKFETLGCAAAIATASMATVMTKGRSLDEVLKITKEQVADELGGLPVHKIHCSILAIEALKRAIQDYKKKIK